MMRLIDIWNSQEAWRRLSQLKKPPKTAYRLLKYHRQTNAEFEAIDQQRVAYVRESGQDSLEPGTVEYDVFVTKFMEFLEQEADLAPLDMDMEALIDALDDEGNVLSETDLIALEPFFQPNKASVLPIAGESHGST